MSKTAWIFFFVKNIKCIIIYCTFAATQIHSMKYILLSFVLALGLSVASQTIHYVNITPAGAMNGTSWGNASADLQAIIDGADAGDTIWVAQGTYKPFRPATNTATILPTDMDNAFVLKDSVLMYGGFDGTESYTDQRNWKNNPTILSGDIGIPDDSTDNANHVVLAVKTSRYTLLDGFIITRGNSRIAGGSTIQVKGVSSILRSRGGGIANYESDARFINLIVDSNYATASAAGMGAGIYNASNTSPVYINVLITHNTSDISGGGMANRASEPILVNVTITQNHANGNGTTAGGMINTTDAGSVYANAKIYNSIIWDNTYGSPTTSVGNVASDQPPSSPTYYNCIVGDVLSPIPPGVSNTNPYFVDSANNDFRLSGISPAIDAGNTSYLTPYGILTDLNKESRFYNGDPDLGAYENQGIIIIPDSKGIVYVKKHVTTGDGSGRNWYHAAKELGNALHAAQSNTNIKYIYVASSTAGDYYPMYNESLPLT
jgi:hypothetical protein